MSDENLVEGFVTEHAEHLLDRAAMLTMRAMIALQPATNLGPDGRAAFDTLMARTPLAEGVSYEAAIVGGIPGWWCRPSTATTKDDVAILYLHGGAYVVGSAAAYRHFAGQIAASAEAPVFVADYALAPERPFPDAVEDAAAVYRGLAQGGRSRIAIVGDSAGGGLALVTTEAMTHAAKAESVPRPVAVVALSPWTDLALTGESITTRSKQDPLLTAAALDQARQSYLKQHDATDPRASPLYGDLADLPPILVHVGEDEILFDDARRYVERATASGALAQLHVWHGMVHVFPANLSLLRAAREAVDEIGAFLHRHLAI